MIDKKEIATPKYKQRLGLEPKQMLNFFGKTSRWNKSTTVNQKPIEQRQAKLFPNPVLAAVVGDATHLLRCQHCIGRSCKEYFMACIPLSKPKNGKIKILVFGDRNWAGKDHLKRVRYVDEFRVFANCC